MTEPDFLTTTRAFYDAIATEYTDRFRDAMDSMPTDRAMLALFADLVRAERPDARTAELGCGPGRVTGHLHRLGLDVCGIDLSPRMVELAREDHPEVPFSVGSLFDLPFRDGELTGAVAWYSIIHTPAERLPEVFAEFARVLAPGGHLLVAFQVGDEPLRLDQPFGRPVSLDFRRLRPEHVEELAREAGLPVTSRTVREPGAEEKTPQAYLFARKPAG
ncbi:methyltransferase family protein [Streptomyces sp. 1114.5]|uniref:class I SAM-dependent DNA methyltransferase n=1 Tax=unclassified Streptomyces TaxID=2593676 RepID=UPI000BCE222C|nr:MULTISPECIES: class I SAM-dependent methyltransferase [unclassified Streptomyces]RKT17601.1 methyltransferase family protein [Streptomyces sp. 1114.5]SOB83804.1 Methyltransferase domain-containing protein [Streptomyces sp. 1331.2]